MKSGLPQAHTLIPVPAALEPRVVFEDTHLLVIEKPAGLLSQGEIQGDPNLVDWCRQRFGRPYVGLVHRLDRNTSGLMVVAKRTKSANRLTDALQAGLVQRTYLAWLTGAFTGNARWKHYLVKDESKNTVRASKESRAGAKEAILNVRAVGRGELDGHVLTLAEFTLETGRSHQIRAQAAFEGYPLLGDLKYGGRANETLHRAFGRHALHSARLEFPHPMGGAPMNFESALPADMAKLRR